MADIALIWDNVNGRADFAIENGDLKMDDGLLTSVIISLFCDRLAEASDVIPDGGKDRRGWWGDNSPGGGVPGFLTGSGLWLEIPGLQTDQKLRALESRVSVATAWMTQDTPPIAESVTPVATYPTRGRVNLNITIRQGGIANIYDLAWSET